MEILRQIQHFLGPKAKEPDRFLVKKDTPFIPTYKDSDYLDEKGLQREIENLARSMKEAQDQINNRQIIARSPKEAGEWTKFQASHKKVWETTRYLTSLEEEYQTVINQSESGQRPLTHSDFSTHQIIYAGAQPLMERLFQQQRNYARRNGFEDVFNPYADLLQFAFTGRAYDIQLGGISLKDILDNNSHALPPSEVFRYLMEAWLIRQRKSHKTVLQENLGDHLFREYPNKTLNAIENLSGKVLAINNLSPEEMDQIVASAQGVRKELAQWAKQLHQKIYDGRRSFYLSILNPQSKDFPKSKEILEAYISKEKTIRVLVLYMAGLQEIPKVYQLYRKTHELKNDPSVGNFYQLLERSIMEYIDEVPTAENILTTDDVTTVLLTDDQTSREEGIPTLDQLGKIVSNIFSRVSKRSLVDYTCTPRDISWGQLVEPQNLAIQFDENRPRLFRVILSYQNDVGELLELNLDFDTAKNKFDWNFVESPTEPNLQNIYRASLKATQQILLYVLSKAEQEYQEKQKVKQLKPVPPSAKTPPRQRMEDEIYQLRKRVRLEAKTSVEIPAFFTLEAKIDEEHDIEKRILSPQSEILEMLDKLASVDRQTVLKGIDEFNGIGRGEFTRKRRRSRDGEILYTLRVNCSVPGGVRVLLHESESSEGVRNFEILDISYRKDIYKKAGI